jgi:hypothetical protein
MPIPLSVIPSSDKGEFRTVADDRAKSATLKNKTARVFFGGKSDE